MKRHRWSENKCIKCGCVRKIIAFVGRFELKTYFLYGLQFTGKAPGCITKERYFSDTIEAEFEQVSQTT